MTSMPEGALTGLKVLDFTHYVAGPYCTKLLADYGADVIKVERPPDGDGSRRMGPYPGDEPHPEKSAQFLHLNTNKRGIAVDLKQSVAAGIVDRLTSWADIVVENYRPGVADRLGIGYERLSSINPAIIYTSISNFGQTGPYRDYRGSEIVFYGMGGEMHSTGLSDREPLKLGGNVGLYPSWCRGRGGHHGRGAGRILLDGWRRGRGDWTAHRRVHPGNAVGFG